MRNEKLALFLVYVILCQLGFSSSLSYLCPKDQALALLEFKNMFTIDPFASKYGECAGSYPKTLSWNTSVDCCSWDGVQCDETTSQVIELDLSCSQLQGKFTSNSSVFQLSNTLERLDFSMNDFSESQIPPNIGGFMSLTHLDLSNSGFTGQIPSEISHLSKLHSLRIVDYSNGFRLEPYDFQQLLTNLTQLRELVFYSVSISSVIPQNFSSYLTTLRISETELYGILPERVFHLSNLSFLDLSRNYQLIVRFPVTKWNSSASLKELYLSDVNFTKVDKHLSNFFGPIRLFNKNWTQLESLYLSSNSLTGPIPSDVSGFQSLEFLLLSSNNLNGTIPSWISSLPSLSYLDLSNNHFIGQIDEFKSEMLFWIDLGNNHLQSPIPKSLFNQSRLMFLNISLNNFSDNLKFSMFSKMSILGTLDLSDNSFSWTNENQVESNLLQLSELDLSSNSLQGSLPIPPTSVEYFFISHNKLSGQIPSTICNLRSLSILDLESNSLNGEIPPCLGNLSTLEVLNVRHNNLSGTIQTNFSFESPLRSFNLRGNKLIGKIPRSLINCKQLEVLDLGNNELNDTFPMWLGTLPNLMVLSLRSNKLHGPIKAASRTKTLFPRLQIIDLATNRFNGNLPTYLFDNLRGMQKDDANMKTPRYIGDEYYEDSITISSKGMSMELVRILTIYTAIDLSSNRFEGYIPSVIGDLTSLVVLNLSHNSFEGHIPASLGSVSALESLDLSFNKLGGEIPVQLASLTFLGSLSLSHNHLVGCIPSGSQFATFHNSSFEGNDGLRGFPLSKDCGDTRVVPRTTSPVLDDQEEDSGFEISWEAALMGYGCGLIIGISRIYIMFSTLKPMWLFRMIEEWEHKMVIMMRKKKK